MCNVYKNGHERAEGNNRSGSEGVKINELSKLQRGETSDRKERKEIERRANRGIDRLNYRD